MLRDAPVIPLIQASDTAVAIETATALAAGGLNVQELVLRTPNALECLAGIARSRPDIVVGAGTVLDADLAERSIAAGARFLVSPGLDEGVVEAGNAHGVPVLPGVATASEAQRAVNLGLTTVKFFPATLAGGVPMLKALASVFGNLRFVPTGGVSAANLADFLALPAVLACGGSWLTPAAEIDGGNFDAITGLAREALALAARTRSGGNG